MIRDITQQNRPVVGVFLGGKILRAGRVFQNKVEESVTLEINNLGSEEYVINQVIQAIKQVYTPEVAGIGIGVPSIVDVSKGIVYNAEHIPSWKKVYLADLLMPHFKTGIYVNNDANCFAVGEKYYGKGQKYSNMVGIIAGVGLGVGIIVDNKLYSGTNCGAGEFGYVPYKDYNYEHYCTTAYFEEKYGIKADSLYTRATKEDKIALSILEQFGFDFGNFIKTILFTLDPQLIVIGGNLTRFFPFIEPHIRKTLRTFPFSNTIEKLQIEVSTEPDAAILGAAALYFDMENRNQVM